MKAIRFLQFTTVMMFVVVVGAGVCILFFRRELLEDYRTLIGIVWPFFVTEVVPALIGTPLTDAVRNLTAKKPTGVTSEGNV